MWNGSLENGDSSRRDIDRSKTSYHVGRRSAGGTFSVENLRVVFSTGVSFEHGRNWSSAVPRRERITLGSERQS
jgi:hypothetical protein